MESAICLRHGCHLPGLTLRIPNSPINGSAGVITSPQFSFSPSSLSLNNTNICIYRRLGHAFSPIVCAMNRNPTPWRNDESDSKSLQAGTVGASLMLACALGIISCGCMKSPKAMAIFNKQAEKPGVVCINREIYPDGRKNVVKCLLDMINVYSNQNQPNSFVLNKNKMVSMKEAAVLKKEAMWMVKSGKDTDAVSKLKKILADCEGAESKFFVEMALVEVLICLGRYEEASRCNCICKQSENRISDSRVPFYSALINTMLNRKESAEKCWEEFEKSIKGEGEGGLPMPP